MSQLALPLVTYGLLSLGLVLCLYLFFSLKLDVSRQRRRWMRQQLELEAALDEMRASFEQQDLESPRAATLRRVRHGSPLESAEQVAAA